VYLDGALILASFVCLLFLREAKSASVGLGSTITGRP
jgi:hypothetical protein